jgi:uncharacterized membrane protein YukC
MQIDQHFYYVLASCGFALISLAVLCFSVYFAYRKQKKKETLIEGKNL